MKRRADPVVQIIDGSWYALGHGFTHEDCCGCGLSHRIDYKLEDGRIFVRYRVDHKRTRENRRRDGIRVIRDRSHKS